ncbi:MAG: hypothetical protein KHZ98_01850 [Actinomyces sp.]|nr:hypothetical protein [Actinomyces sp.]
MTLADTPTSQRKPLPSFVRRLAITLGVALVGALAVSASWLMHRPVGYSGDAHTSSLISPDFASGFDVAWEMTASELGVSGQLYSHAKVDDTLVAIFKDKDQPPTLVAIDLRGTQPSVLWHRELAESSAPILTWDDSIIVDGQTIRVSDGQVTATWEFPIPDSVISGISDKGQPLLDVGQDLDRSEKMSFVAVQWPMAVVCYPSDRPRMFQDYDYMCLGHNKDGTEAWRYAADVRGFEPEKPGVPMNVPMANGYVPAKQNTLVPGTDVNRFLNLLDGSVTEPVSADFTTLTPVTDGWAFSGTMADDSEAPALVTITANGTEISRIPLTDNAIRLRGADTIRCWDETGQTITPTSEQLATTLISGEVTWAHLCTHTDNYAYPSRITAINGRRLYVTNEAGGADRISYPSTAAISTDGSLILSTPPTHDYRKEPAPPETLYAVPSGIPLTSLDEIGATDASVFYDDLLIASPTRSDSWSARLRSFLGFYPHQDTVLMGITPKRAS